jgi:hypothetical protein
MSELTAREPVIDPKDEVLKELDKAEKVVRDALEGTLDTIAGARRVVLEGKTIGGSLYWAKKLAQDIQRYVELIP